MNAASRTRALVVSALLLATPALSHASQDVPVNACVKAFVSTSLEKERPFTVQTEESVATPLDHAARAFRISLKATGKHSGKQVAKATCVVDRNGVVLALNGKPYTDVGQEQILSAR
ncbi:MAG TPA: hypothetical protein PKE27_16390 [Povalibacter sp.]|uniref:hypothetical protein n=1 Tax=Povalibacter sp. TaxID=1962978 RepID=UPI002C893066|nr:hypothetical protein [Povalibacter sp.]HMN46159.1 hypothetical protein [Povalibacter sp.]